MFYKNTIYLIDVDDLGIFLKDNLESDKATVCLNKDDLTLVLTLADDLDDEELGEIGFQEIIKGINYPEEFEVTLNYYDYRDVLEGFLGEQLANAEVHGRDVYLFKQN